MTLQYKHKKILIWGIGITGISCINFFLKKGIFPKIVDNQTNAKKLKLLNKIPKFVPIKLGNNFSSWVFESDIIIISPGIPLYHPLLIKAAEMNIEIIGDVELFCRETNKPIIAITGSNGKTTVTSILQKISKKSYLKIGIGGNIGTPVLNLLEGMYDTYILELSSFQLETTNSLKAKIAVVLNITPDHIDRYPDGFNYYKEIKLKIYNNAETCIFNMKEKLSNKKKYNYQKKITFGIDKGNYHILKNNASSWLSYNNKKLLNINQTSLRGTHNFENALVALAIADKIKLPRKHTLHAIATFKGLNHRFQIIPSNSKITCINDSKSTNIASTIVAINNVDLKSGTLRLILGGNRKLANFNSLKQHIKYIKIKLYCYGKDGRYIAQIFPKISTFKNTLNQIMHLIKSQTSCNDIILFSPGCSSTDQFLNFKERGQIFTQLVKKLF